MSRNCRKYVRNITGKMRQSARRISAVSSETSWLMAYSTEGFCGMFVRVYWIWNWLEEGSCPSIGGLVGNEK